MLLTSLTPLQREWKRCQLHTFMSILYNVPGFLLLLLLLCNLSTEKMWQSFRYEIAHYCSASTKYYLGCWGMEVIL